MTTKIRQFFHTFHREMILFFLLSCTFLCTLPKELHGWNSGWYAMDYSLGFDSRLLIGSVLKLFYSDFLPANAVYSFVIFSTFVLLALLSCLLGYALRHNEGSTAGKGLLVLIAFYLLCPGSPAYLWSTENMGRFDLYLMIFTLLAACLCCGIKSIPVRLLLFTICGLAALATHQVFIFIFFPLLFTMYLITITEEKAKTTHIILALAGMGILGIVFLYFQFFSQIHVTSCEELVALLSARTDLVVSDVALRYEYFTGIAQSTQDLMLNQLGERIRYGIITLFLLSPLFIIYGWFWMQILKTARGKYLLILLSQLAFIPAFLLTIDWGRWFGAFLTVQALQIVILAAKKDAVVLSALTHLNALIHKHPLCFLCTGIWLGSLHKFEATLLPDAPVFFTSLYQLYSTIF